MPAFDPMGAPKSLLVIRFSSAGDLVLTSKALSAIREAYPQTRISILTKPAYEEIAARLPGVDHVVVWRGGWTVTAGLRFAREGYDSVLDLHGSSRSRLLAFFIRLRARRRLRAAVWTKRPLLQSLATRYLGRRYRATRRIADRYLDAAQQLFPNATGGTLSLTARVTDQRAARERLLSRGWNSETPIVAVSPGALWATKRWPAAYYAELVAGLVQRGFAVALVGGREDADLADEVIVGAGVHLLNLVGGTTWSELFGVLSLSAAFVGNDSGPMHMARALGTPTIALFGSTDPGQFDWTGHRVLFAGTPCAPCSLYGLPRCPRGHFRCMQDLKPLAALRAVDGLLKDRG